MTDVPQLIYVHDPMCSWCWGFRPAFERLCAQLPAQIQVRWLLGGLARDSDEPMPSEMQARLQETWRCIQQRIPGTRFNFAFWHECQPRRSTWPACRAVIAARSLDASLQGPMVLAIQHAYYLEARNPSDADTLIALAEQLGLPGGRFARLLERPDTQAALLAEIARARQLGAGSFPSLRLQTGRGHWPVPVDYTDADAMLATIQTLLEP